MNQHLFRIIVLCLGFTTGLLAQTPTFDMQTLPDSVSSLDFGFRKLLFDENQVDQSALSGTYLLRYKHVFGDKFNGIASMNYNDFAVDGFESNGIGNIYLGAQYKLTSNNDRASSLDFGLYLPTANEEAVIGAYSNITDFNAYFDIDFGLSASYRAFSNTANGLRYSYEVGINYFKSDQSFGADDSELYANYGLSLGYNFSEWYVNLEALGILILTEDDGFGDNSVHSLAGGFGYTGGRVIPSVFYKLYIDDDISELVNGVIGLNLMYRI